MALMLFKDFAKGNSYVTHVFSNTQTRVIKKVKIDEVVINAIKVLMIINRIVMVIVYGTSLNVRNAGRYSNKRYIDSDIRIDM